MERLVFKVRNISKPQAEQELRYDPATGNFYRLNTRGRWKAGQLAGCKNTNGYICLSVLGVEFYAHRLAWLIMTGSHPEFEVDHKDGNPSNNSWSNLRLATSSQNKQNTNLRSDNSFGKGVVRHKGRKKPFQARINHDGRSISLGYYISADQAQAAYSEAARKFFGEFAQTGARRADNDNNEEQADAA